MKLKEHLDKDNLHHAYLIEGAREEIIAELAEFLREAGLPASGDPEFFHVHADAFKIEDARNLKSFEREKSFSSGKKIFLISANSILFEAQGSLLKIFEEPVPDTHFFLVMPDVNPLMKTLLSRFYIIRLGRQLENEAAENFIAMVPARRVEFIKEFIAEGEEGGETESADSIRSKALEFLDSIEFALHRKGRLSETFPQCYEHMFKVRRFLRMPGSSVKILLESVALIVPVLE